MRTYLNRYEDFLEDGDFKIVPGIELPIKSTDKYIPYKKGKERLDKISDDKYGSPLFGWLILLANPIAGSIEFEIPNNFMLRVPFPLIESLQDYNSAVEQYKLYYGEE
jgi:hypothetical protein